jgi:hypothetical protein
MDSKLCACGNKGHRNLSVWLDPPSGNDSESEDFDPVENGELDWEEIEQEIRMLMPLAISSQGYCIPCQRFIDEWPEPEWLRTGTFYNKNTYPQGSEYEYSATDLY